MHTQTTDTAHDTDQTDLRTNLHALLEHLTQILPAQAPIRDFVHHNTLHGFQHLPFPEALKAARALTEQYGYWPAATFRTQYQQGRIQQTDLDAVLQAHGALQCAEPLLEAHGKPITRLDIYRTVLIHPITPLSYSQFVWQIEENQALEAVQPAVHADARAQLLAASAAHGWDTEATAVNDLWQACLQVLNLPSDWLHVEDLMNFSPARAARLFGAQLEAGHIEQQVKQHGRDLLDQLVGQLGSQLTLRGLLKALLGVDILDEIRPLVGRAVSLWLDQGMAGWQPEVTPEPTSEPMPEQPSEPAPTTTDAGFYAYWKRAARLDWGSVLMGLDDWQSYLDSLPDSAEQTIEAELRRMGIPRADWMDYLERLALELPGWSGMFLWRHCHPGYAGLNQPVNMLDYLAVRLVLEHAFARSLCREHWQMEANLSNIRGRFRRHNAEFMVRYYTFERNLPEYLLSLAQQMINRSRPGVYEDADWQQLAHMIWTWSHSPWMNPDHGRLPFDHGWRLFLLAQHVGLDGAAVRRLDQATLDTLFACADTLDDEYSGYLWLQAYERHYREQLFSAIVGNHQRGNWPSRGEDAGTRPQAQVIFCMDDREEGIRRHLEEINPAVETLGAAAFFNLPMSWQGLDDDTASKLCPVLVTPEHRVREQAGDGMEDKLRLRLQQRGQRLRVREALHQLTRQNLLTGTILSLVSAPAALLVLAGKSFAPLWLGQQVARWRGQIDQWITTRVQFQAVAEDPDRSASHPQSGFTDQEQAARIGNFLSTHGLTQGFARLIVLMGHYSSNQNNPHQAAYGCSACSGRYSGPNARTFAAMANRPEVRRLLAEQSISLPGDCWFIGAEHDTCTDTLRWTDLDLLPPRLSGAFTQLRHDLEAACQHSAHERCRKLVSAPSDPDLEQALAHVAERALDYSQPRPELGHVTHAAALIGRRQMSQGVFFDRRAFLISYDYRQDPDGLQLESILLNVIPVGAGISLEYYFSTVSQTQYGSGTKITHNITGLLGVMEGAGSDLRTGLPKQMIEIHEPMRLLIVLEVDVAVAEAIYARQPLLQELIGNGWVRVATKHPETAKLALFEPGKGFVTWEGEVDALPLVARSANWYLGHHEHLGPALITTSTLAGGISHV